MNKKQKRSLVVGLVLFAVAALVVVPFNFVRDGVQISDAGYFSVLQPPELALVDGTRLLLQLSVIVVATGVAIYVQKDS